MHCSQHSWRRVLTLSCAVVALAFAGCDSPDDPKADPVGADPAAAGGASTDGKPRGDTKPAETIAAETKAAETKAAETKAAETKAAETIAAETKPETAAGPNPALFDPSLANDTAPEKFRAKFVTTKGEFVVEVTRAWSPNGADRFYNLVKIGYFSGVKFFRVVKSPNLSMAQFGIHGDPRVNSRWQNANILDDPVVQSNQRGFVTFAKTPGPNSRSVQFFINYADRNSFLDPQGFSPFGRVVSGMDVVDNLESRYGEAPSAAQPQIQAQGNAFLDANFPGLDEIRSATIETEG